MRAELYIFPYAHRTKPFTERRSAMYDLQKASLLKRFSAFLLDLILVVIVITGFAYLISVISGYDTHLNRLTEIETYYEKLYSVDFDIAKEDYDKLPEAEREKIDHAYEEFATEDEVVYTYNLLMNLTLVIIIFSIMLSFVALEFVVPMIFGNGQTIGKKIFAIGVMHVSGVRLRGTALFARSIVGKCAMETLIPLMILFSLLFGGGGLVAIIVLGLILILEIFVFFRDKLWTPIHDVLSYTVCVDLASQMIFDTKEELIAYKARIHAESVEHSDY